MEVSKEYEQEIDLKDMLFYVLYRWRSVLLIAIVVCMLSGGYTIVYNHLISTSIIIDSTEKQDTLEDDVTEEIKEYEKRNPIKHVIIGFVMGIFGTTIWYTIFYLLNGKMHGEREIHDKYGYYLLGTIPRKGKKKFLSCIDYWLEMIEGTSEGISENEAYQIVAIKVTNLSQKGETILVTGTIAREKLQSFMNMIALQIKDVTLLMGSNMNTTVNTLELLTTCDKVILVEENDKSCRAKIQKEYESLAVLGKQVLGYVIV